MSLTEGSHRDEEIDALDAPAVAHDVPTNQVMLGTGCDIDLRALVGLVTGRDANPALFGEHCVVRAFSVIHAGVRAGSHVRIGHHVLVRDPTTIGDRVVIGTGTTIDGNVTIGSFVKIESHVYIPTHTKIGDRVFIGPGATMTNDRYPLRRRSDYRPEGPIVEDDVTIGAGAVILSGVRLGRGAFVAAGAVVTRSVAPWTLVRGNPGRSEPLPERLHEENHSLRW